MRKHSTACGINEVAIAVGYRQKGVWSLEKKGPQKAEPTPQGSNAQKVYLHERKKKRKRKKKPKRKRKRVHRSLHHARNPTSTTPRGEKHPREITTATGGKGGVAAGTGQNP
jgi:hypothetical protein